MFNQSNFFSDFAYFDPNDPSTVYVTQPPVYNPEPAPITYAPAPAPTAYIPAPAPTAYVPAPAPVPSPA